MLASLLTLVISPEVHLQKLWSVRVPGIVSVLPGSVRLSRSGNQIAWVAVQAEKVQGTYWFDIPNQRFRVLSPAVPDSVLFELGRETISFTVEDVTRTFDLKTGLLKATTPTITIKKRGLTTPIKSRQIRIYDARANRYLIPKPATIPAKLGSLIWDTPKRRLSIFRKNEQTDYKEIVEWEPGSFKEIARAPASYYVEGFNRVVGNPEAGPFAIYFSSNREPRLTGAFGPKLTLI